MNLSNATEIQTVSERTRKRQSVSLQASLAISAGDVQSTISMKIYAESSDRRGQMEDGIHARRGMLYNLSKG
jgi:hypothetical protein